MGVIHEQGADRIGPCITTPCLRMATVTGGGLWCQPCDLSICLEAELGARQLIEFLDGGHSDVPAQRDPGYYVGNWDYPEPPVWSDDDLPYFRDDDEAMS